MIENQIQKWLDRQVDRSLARQTRVHPLPSFPNQSVFIKREDELSSGISGSKLRKYASLVPFLKRKRIQEVALIGGPNSNNLVGLLQILKEAGIHSWLFIRKAADTDKKGNALFLDMLAGKDSTFVIERSEWDNVESIAHSFLSEREVKGIRAKLIQEGALQEESLPGCITLAEDFLRNESESPGNFFTSIYIDSGTGMNSIGLLLGLAILDSKAADRRIHISLISGSESDFRENLKRFKENLLQSLNLEEIVIPPFGFLYPPISRKFGSVSQTLFESCRVIAKTEGLLMDPTYSVKHYMAMQEHMRLNPTDKTSLFIFNGSALGLAGFQSQLVEID